MTETVARTAPLAVTDRGAGRPRLALRPRLVRGPRRVRLVAARSIRASPRGVRGSARPRRLAGARRTSPPATSSRPLVATIDALGIDTVVPVGLSHAGWAAIDLRRRLGAERVPGVVLMDWMVLGTPPGFADALGGLQSPAWADVREGLTSMWLDGLDIAALTEYVPSMKTYGESHWSRAGREIATQFSAQPVPLQALEAAPALPDAAPLRPAGRLTRCWAARQENAATHAWFSVRRLDARSHFPMFEVPEDMVASIESFVRRSG